MLRSRGKVTGDRLEPSLMETRLPAPSLVVLIGPGASGKSTWAAQHFDTPEIVSSDNLRAVVGAGSGDQEASADAFDLLGRIVDMRTTRGLTTVIDTLGLDSTRRQHWVQTAHDQGMGVYAVVFDTPDEECLRRNEGRDTPIPKSVLRRQLRRFQDVKREVANESFDQVLTNTAAAVVAPQFVDEPPSETQPAGHTFGLILSRFNWPGDQADRGRQIASVARRAEEAGFRDLWVMDHFRQIRQVGRPWEDMPESYSTLSFLAGVTSKIRLGTLVSGVTYRNPALLGKAVATLDVLSGGRAICGIGLGWDEEEHRSYGWDFPAVADRYELLEDALQLLPLLWGKGAPSFKGRAIEAESLACYPRPIQEKIPILVGGSGEKRTLRLVAKYGDACNVFGNPERVRQKVEVLSRHCDKLGRDMDDLEVTHLTNVVAGADGAALRTRVGELRARSQPYENYARVNNAGTVEDLVRLFTSYQAAGASHSIVAMPDVHLERSIETFADVIARFEDT